MTTFEPILPGLYARSEALVEATRDHDRQRIGDVALAERQRRDLEDVVGVQHVASFTRISTGQLPWQDLFRPFKLVLEGLEPRTLVRFLDTNTFYRRPDVPGDPGVNKDNLAAFFDTYLPSLVGAQGVATLPSPTAFVTGAADEDGSLPEPGLAREIGEALYPALIAQALERGYGTVVLSDPWLTAHPEPGELLATLTHALPEDAERPNVLLQLPFADAGELVAEASAPVDGVLVDLTLTDLGALAEVPDDKVIGLGLVDARSSIVERSDLLVATATRAAEDLAHDLVLLAPSGDLQHVPEPIARRKVRALGEAALAARAKLGGEAQ